MYRARFIIGVGGFGLWMALQSHCLLAQLGPGGGPAANAEQKAEKSLLPEAAKASSEAKPPELCQCSSQSDSISVERINRALRGPLHSNGLDFVNTPLKDIAEQLATDYEIPIQLDKAAMDEIGVNAEQPVDINLHGVSLQSALKIMLKNIQLTYVIRDEVLFITSPDAAEKDLKVCVYNVSELVGKDGSSDLDTVADVIRSCVLTDTWSANGGGQSEVRTIEPDLLVISQTASAQEQVRDLLNAIRKSHQQGDTTPTNAAKIAVKHKNVVTRSYTLKMNPSNNPNELSRQIRDLIVSALPEETWSGRLADGQGVLLEVFHDRIVVRQTPAVQEKVEKVLTDSGIATPTQQPNSPGMPGGFGGISGGLGESSGRFGGKPGPGFGGGGFGRGGALINASPSSGPESAVGVAPAPASDEGK
ncbi:MAG TPA: STN domain-containing protein [Lacipirellulaceae bacterium]|jgi:hypothetical protein|nr:STN domain-containing protein [Lacipirellulaceae bacterium]